MWCAEMIIHPPEIMCKVKLSQRKSLISLVLHVVIVMQQMPKHSQPSAQKKCQK